MNLRTHHFASPPSQLRIAPRVSRASRLGLRTVGAGGAARIARACSPRRAAGATSGVRFNPMAPRPTHFPAKAKSVIWLFMNGGPSQVDTWDYKPELEKRDGQELARLRQEHRLLHRPGRPADEVAVQVRAARAVGHLGLGNLSQDGRARRRHGLHPFVLHQDEQPLAGPVRDQHRHEPDGLSLRRRLGDLRPGDRKSEPARLRHDVRHARPRTAQGARPELGRRLFAGRVPGHGAQRPGSADQQSVSPRRHDRRSSRSPSSICCASSTSGSRSRTRPTWPPASKASSWPIACR